MRSWVRLLYAVIAASLLGPAAVPAQDCVRVEATPEKSTLTVRHSVAVSSTAPAEFCELEPGLDYLLSVSRPNCEKRWLKFSFANYGESADFGGIRLSRVGRSLVFPGWGQYNLGYSERAVSAFMFLGLSAFKVTQAYRDHGEAEERYDFFRNLARESSEQAVIERADALASKAAKDANQLREHAWLTAALSGWLYAGNLFETFLLSSPPKASRIEGTDFSVEIPRRSRARAAFRSMLFPGLGQKYNGSFGKGLLFQTSFIFLAYFTLDAKMHYDLATVDYQLAFDRYQAAVSAPEIEAARAEAKKKFEAKDAREEEMYAFAISAGTIWFLNVLDAIVFGGTAEEQERFEFDTSYESATVRTGLRFNF